MATLLGKDNHNKIILTTTLNRLRRARVCTDSYQKLLKHLGGDSFDHDAPINILTILESNGVDDALLALRASSQDCSVLARFIAADLAKSVLPIFEKANPDDDRPRKAIEAARAFASGELSSDELAAAEAAAWDAAEDAAWNFAWNVARAAARAAARDVAEAAAWDVARDVARNFAWDTTLDAQAAVIRKWIVTDLH